MTIFKVLIFFAVLCPIVSAQDDPPRFVILQPLDSEEGEPPPVEESSTPKVPSGNKTIKTVEQYGNESTDVGKEGLSRTGEFTLQETSKSDWGPLSLIASQMRRKKYGVYTLTEQIFNESFRLEQCQSWEGNISPYLTLGPVGLGPTGRARFDYALMADNNGLAGQGSGLVSVGGALKIDLSETQVIELKALTALFSSQLGLGLKYRSSGDNPNIPQNFFVDQNDIPIYQFNINYIDFRSKALIKRVTFAYSQKILGARALELVVVIPACQFSLEYNFNQMGVFNGDRKPSLNFNMIFPIGGGQNSQ